MGELALAAGHLPWPSVIVVRLAGGLGNQMFQYAAGRSLAKARNTELKLDISSYATQSLRSYRLGYLNICEQLASPEDMAQFGTIAMGRLAHWKRRLRQWVAATANSYVLEERHPLRFDRRIVASPDNTLLLGYWQNERYFSAIRETLNNEFQPRYALESYSLKVAETIRDTAAVGVHVRRGDYASNRQTRAIHGLCSPDYYERCGQAMVEQLPQAHFVVFSDDIGWAKRNIRFPRAVTYVQRDERDRDYEDLHLLSLCRHFILANSTFSWWGVWLANAQDGIVYAPQRWFATNKYDTSEFIPSQWRRA
jgi:hypothetical protein